eukprot:scaffold145_cov195-Alexandrium_tamarense.AAC.21
MKPTTQPKLTTTTTDGLISLQHTETMDVLNNLNIPTQLYPSLAIILVEIFPDLCLGWWTPPSLNLKQYQRMATLRVVLQVIAWYPVVSTGDVLHIEEL